MNRALGAVLFLLAVVLLLLLSPAALRATEPSLPPGPEGVSTYQLLTNPGVEVYDPPYAQYQGIDCQVATGWQRFWYDGLEPYWMDTRVFAESHLGSGHVEKVEGETSQLIIATEPYTAGIQQTVGGLTPGLGYGFHAAMLTIYQTSAPPAVDGTMFKQVGIDPAGGTDPQAPGVVWSPPNDRDEFLDIQQRVAVYAEAPTMTVFVRVLSPYESGGLPYLNYSFLDSAILARTPVVTATSPATTDLPIFTVRWDNAQVAPGGGELKWHDVQWLDEAEGVWHDWITMTYDLEENFVGEEGHAYRFRARAWQRYPNNAHLYGPYRPEGDTRTVVGGPQLVGRVVTNEGLPLAGATVAVSGTAYAATTGGDGFYALDVLPWPDPQAVVASHPRWQSPSPAYDVTFGPTDTVALLWAMRPLDDRVVNGEFEKGLDGWSLDVADVVTPAVVTAPVHTGRFALSLGGQQPFSGTVGVSQTVVLTDAWEPGLSFWYRPAATATEGVFNVVLTVVTETTMVSGTASLLQATAPLTAPITTTRRVTTTYVLTPLLAVSGWEHVWAPLGPPKVALTATTTVHFLAWTEGVTDVVRVYVDEVSLGSTPGGPHEVYLPLVMRTP